MTWSGGDGTAQNFGPIYIIIPKMNQIGDKVRKNEVLKTLTKTLTFVDTDADAATNTATNANAEGSTIALRERC